MARSTIIIIGAGVGGLAAGIYGQRNGYQTQIFEMHTKPGGQCASWKRGGYTFDACVHHFFGCRPGSRLYRLWEELGAMPRELVRIEDCTAVVAADGRRFVDHYDLDRLREELVRLSPADTGAIDGYIHDIRAMVKNKMADAWLPASFWSTLALFPAVLAARKWMKLTMTGYAARFSDPFLKKAFCLLVYSQPEGPFFFHLLRHAGGITGDVQWPVGGAGELATSLEGRYLALGGQVHYRSRVTKIMVENGKAVGVRLADGTEHRGDIVIANADGRRTIFELLDGRYINDTVCGYCAPISDDTPFALSIFLGVDRDLSAEPSSLALLLAEPVTMAGRSYEYVEAQLYGFDRTMAPPGKGVVKVELPASYAYWKRLYEEDRPAYKLRKQEVANQVIDILEGHFAGLRRQVEALDVTTLMTWERYMGGTQGWFNLPNRAFSPSLRENLSDKKFTFTLPGLSGFYFAGTWATMTASLLHNANSGKTVIRRICADDGKKFRALA